MREAQSPVRQVQGAVMETLMKQLKQDLEFINWPAFTQQSIPGQATHSKSGGWDAAKSDPPH